MGESVMEKMNAGSSKKVVWIVILSAGLMAGLIVWKIRQSPGPGGPGGPGPGNKTGPQKVSAIVAHPSSLPLGLEFSGTLLAWNEVQLVPEMAGRIVKLNIKEGQMVQEGDILLTIFDEDLRAQEEKLRLQEAIAARNLVRSKQLLQSGSGTQQEADNAENQLNNIRADLHILQEKLRKAILKAPFSGRLGLSNVSPGAYVSPGTALAWLRDTRKLKLEFSVPEAYTSLFQKGGRISFSSGNPLDTMEAGIFALEPGLDSDTRNLRIRAEVANTEGKFLPGNFARVWPAGRSIPDALMIPSQSIIPDNRGKKVIVYRNGKALFCTVETGIRTLDKVQILSGIIPGDTVLTTGLMFVKPESELIITKLEESK